MPVVIAPRHDRTSGMLRPTPLRMLRATMYRCGGCNQRLWSFFNVHTRTTMSLLNGMFELVLNNYP